MKTLRHQGQLQDILSQLDRINRKIKKNIEEAWQDDLENKVTVVILDDISNGLDDEQYDVKYNGWLEDIQDLKGVEIVTNKLIAEFMADHNFYREGLSYDSSDELLKYHSSWDWLMPVVEKCYQCDYEEGGDLHMLLNDAIMTINISEVYKAVVEFIKWYNENK